ncbi:MAG: metallophosphatase [Coleofasciculaceae cyanobacterium SM2_1_6]|nr:metallophosphatase [Coleofasciculaceae cyanobacterium SM2_1_6]
MWAILSGIEGNLAAYEAVLADLKRQRASVTELYILGDVIGVNPESNRVIQRLQSPKARELKPQVCQGWWEEQLLILHGLGKTDEPTALIDRYGIAMTKTLWDAVDRSHLPWLRSLDFGFFELDCLLIHGSTVGVEDELNPETPPVAMIDRLLRMDANYLFCGRSGLTFEYEIAAGSLTSEVMTLVGVASPLENRLPQPRTATLRPRKVIGVGNVGRIPGHATYTLYQPNTGKIQFQTVRYGAARGFQS